MFAVVLIVLALAGGAAATYFLMDAPRRSAVRRLAALDRDRREFEDEYDRLDAEVERAEARGRQLAAAAAAHERQRFELAGREAEFARRVITFDDLAAENKILRAELRSALVHAAYLEHAQHAHRAGASAATAQRDQIGRAYFEEVAAAARKGLTPSSYPANAQRIRAAAGRVRAAGFDLPGADEEAALAGLHRLFERAVRAAVEREEQARLREHAREELARQREADALAEQAERERAAVQAALDRALADAAGRHAGEVERLRAQLAEAEAKSRRAVSLAQLTKAGHVYVISNVGSFGPGVFKIGMTRRAEPMDRVDELGDASVPFPFDVHMLIKCDDAPRLEAALHQAFHARRVNRVNPRKEFFRATVEEIVAAVRRHHGEVEYTADPEALEYLSSRTATDAEVSEIERVYAQATPAGSGGESLDE